MGTIASSDPASAPDIDSPSSSTGGSTIVTASYSRFRRRLVMAGIAAFLVVAGAVTAIVVTVGGGAGATATAAGPTPRLPTLGDPAPVLTALSTQAPVPDPHVLAAQLAPLLSASALGPDVEAEVVDVATGQVLDDVHAGDPAIPASTAKLLTSVAALTTLDPQSTLTTTVVAGASPGEVVLVGGGDPTLTRATTSPNYPGAASIVDLARQVTAALPAGTKVTRVVVDDSLFTGPATAPGWQPADTPSSYAAPVTATSVDAGRVTPTSTTRTATPALDAGQALASALGAPHAQVALGSAPAAAKTLGAVHSAPIARLVEQALSQSDNMIAEALARHVAIARHQPATFQGAAQSVVAALKDLGVDVGGVTLNDGSGLSRNDRVPPQLLVSLLTEAADGKLPRAWPIVSGLSVAGLDGTLADRGGQDPASAAGLVRGKTGTLAGVHALAGTVVTADHRLLTFAVIANNTPGGSDAAEAALDKVAATLAGCGCR